jgi:hypothetical protein
MTDPTSPPPAAPSRAAMLPKGLAVVAGDRQGLAVALDWAATEGWRPGRHDAAAFEAVDPAGVLGLRDGGDVVTTLVAARYDASFGFLGLYITEPSRRGEGLGTVLFSAGLAHLTDVTCLGLDGVVERESVYASLGFTRAHLSQRWVTTAACPPVSEGRTVEARRLGAEVLGAYERGANVFPAPREGFLAAWLAAPESDARAVVDPAGAIRGYGVVRRCVTGAKIAPLFADDPVVAETLLDDLLARGAAWGPVSIDVPDPNDVGVELVRARGMVPEFACVRMYAGPDPGMALPRVYGITSFELG